MDLVGTYADEAMTGTNDRRDDFRRLMDDAKRDVYDIVVVWHTDRLHRNMLNAFVTLADLIKRGKDFRSVLQRDLNDPNNPMRLMMFALYSWRDEDISREISDNVRRGQREKAMKCHPLGQRRFGWDIAGAHIDDKGKYHAGDHYEINEREAEAVRIMYRMRRAGHAWTSIASRLGELGYLNKQGNPITDNMVRRSVGNEAYKGVYRYADIVVEGDIPRIVSEAEWAAAQHPRRRAKHRRHVYVRPGMVFGELETVEVARIAPNHCYIWLCKCHACGGEKIEWAQRLTSGKATHCGCRSASMRKRDQRGRYV